MSGLLFPLGIFIGALSGSLSTSFLTARRNRNRAPRHEHVWGEWEDCRITPHNSQPESGQRRRCVTCNYKEVRKVFS
ncbi:hypothetical protein SEA_IPHANE7_121 [Mycobacterium phage IPhane7]|uniref:Uncharacterized protein n=3 Tax=Bongovirus bongo TaxID=1983750 RepID=A0A0M3UKE3_9CAUD|nr:hypothetical protein SEA_BRICOLE_125 [Mycobacterium phage Bricole]AXQ52743.1 hypothetical protein SEA_IPHANE7_121 [Mycobacterium phage IPhane7]QGJ93246.1 hypothetical protein SEA_TYDAWG_118 [Mycobacterium phage TyDawg]WNM75315.1 membrane protein [Mycobacterium phage Auspice]